MVTRMTATSTAPVRRPARELGSSSVAPRLTTLMFGATAFFGAGMLFLVQPMIARLLLPSYGGAATVWSTSSLFFQVVLLLGYVYTDRSSRLGPRRQRMVHCVVLLLPLLVLPLVLPSDAAPPALSATLESEAVAAVENEATGLWFLVCRVLGSDAGQGVDAAVA